MFRRKWSGLPSDPIFPSDLEGLGLFINDMDEIRSLENPKKYYHAFTYKNERWNFRQRFHMNEAVQKVVFQRLEGQGLEQTLLPLGTTDRSKAHVPIFTTVDLARKKKARVVLIFGESIQDLGLLAHRVASGKGGVNKGSMVSVVQTIKSAAAEARVPRESECPGAGHGDDGEPGIILANTGELFWWPEGCRALGPILRHALPMASSVHWGRQHREALNSVPGNRTTAEHVRYMFEKVVPHMAGGASLDVVAVGDAADVVEAYLSAEKTWPQWEGKLASLALLGGQYDREKVESEGFKQFLRHRTRAWTLHPSHPLDSRLSGPEGNPFSRAFVNLGCPVYSAGPILHTELLLVAAHASVARWQTQVHAVEDYQNPEEAVVVDEEELQAANGEADQHPWPEALAVEKAREAERAEQARKKEEERKKAGEEKRQAEEEAKKKKAAEQQEKAEEERLRTGREREKAKEEAAGRVKEEKKKARLEKQRAELAAKPAAGDAAGAAAATPGTGTSRPDLETGGTGSAVRSTGATEQRGGRADEDDDGDAEEGEDFDPLAGHEELKATLAGAMDALQRTVMRAFADRPRVLPYQDEDGDEDEDEDAQERAGEDERDVGC